MKFRASVILASGLFAACGFMPLSAAEARAASAPPFWSGTDSSGVAVSGGQCPVEVEHETLTFRIPQLPSAYLSGEQLNEYQSEVTAEYTLYNPTDSDIEMKLLFPFGAAPEYAEEGAADLSRYRITADGAPVKYALRHTFLSEGGGSFDIDEGMARLSDGFRADGFFKPDMPVTEYRYEVRAAAEEMNPYLELIFDLNPVKTKIIGNINSARVENGRLAVRLVAERTFGETGGVFEYCFWAAGEEPAVFSTSAIRGGEVVKDAAIAQGKQAEQCAFLQFLLARRAENAQVSDADWYNAALDYMNYYGSYSKRNGADCVFVCPELTERQLMRWYEYELPVPAGGRTKNEVTAPLYPHIEGNKNSVYRYTYYLSPARGWADFKAIDVFVETPFHLTDGSLEFAEKEGGYTFSRDSLPLGELTFTLYEGDSPIPSYEGMDLGALFTALKIAALVLIPCAIGVAVFFAVRGNRPRRERKKKDEEGKS